MRCGLVLHPDSRCHAISAIDVEVARSGSEQVTVRYVVRGDIDGLRLPAPAAPRPADGLWRHTCLEAFAQDEAGDGYVEFNLSPSTEWAAYRFDSYRAGMQVCSMATPGIAFARTPGGFELYAALALPRSSTRLGLSAVIEEVSGRISYWALRHPPGRPDFHHADGFALELPAPSSA